MCVLNGRINESDNNFTSVSARGNAVVDYICVPHDALEKCEYFKVKTMRSVIEDGKLTCLLGERSKAPDHSALITEISFFISLAVTNQLTITRVIEKSINKTPYHKTFCHLI